MKLIASSPISPYQPSANGTNSLVNPSKGTKFTHAGELLFFSSAPSKWQNACATASERRRVDEVEHNCDVVVESVVNDQTLNRSFSYRHRLRDCSHIEISFGNVMFSGLTRKARVIGCTQ